MIILFDILFQGVVVSVCVLCLLLVVLLSNREPKVNESDERTVIVLPEALDSKKCPKNFTILPLVLISMDGFRPDYIYRGKNPTLMKLIENGVSAKYMSTSFPSITFPNHYTIVTVSFYICKGGLKS